jgi:hypothetical protein
MPYTIFYVNGIANTTNFKNIVNSFSEASNASHTNTNNTHTNTNNTHTNLLGIGTSSGSFMNMIIYLEFPLAIRIIWKTSVLLLSSAMTVFLGVSLYYVFKYFVHKYHTIYKCTTAQHMGTSNSELLFEFEAGEALSLLSSDNI